MRLLGRTALITGAASGIGREIAFKFAGEGAKVAIADLDLDAANATVRMIQAAQGQALGVAMDVTNEHAVGEGVATIVAAFGAIDILVSNAGIQIVHPIEDFTFNDWKYVLIGLARVVAKEGAKHGVRANVVCPGFVRTPLVDNQIPEQAKALGISEEDVVRKVMLKETVDGEFTTVEDAAEVALLFASFPSNALTGQSLIVSHGWHMQ